MTARLVRHADPACVGGWSAVVEDVPRWAERRPARLDLICWTCGRVVHLTGLAGLDGIDSTRRYPASVPPGRVATGRGPARVVGLLHVESWLYAGRLDSVFEWLVTDVDGNQLGAVSRTVSLRANAAARYEWGSLDHAAGHGRGFSSPEAATRALLRAVYDRPVPADPSDPAGTAGTAGSGGSGGSAGTGSER